MDNFFIFCAQYLFVVAFLIAAIYFFKQARKLQARIVILGVICACISYAIALIAGQLYFDPRPFVEEHFIPLIAHDTENGFPSDHVLMLSVIAAVVSIFNLRWAAVLWLITGLVAYSRVYVGVHHSIDVLASILIVVIVTAVSYYLFRGTALNRATTSINNHVLKRFGLGY
ncbi:MAG: undecaprenyl-diphosphate phosphatase BcrC [Mucilaginibacter sp.]